MDKYRKNVAGIIRNGKGKILMCERIDHPGVWQTVQGGIDKGETPESALLREMNEEIGLKKTDFEIRAVMLEHFVYDWSLDVQTKLSHTGFIGQDQIIYLIDVKDSAIIVLDNVEFKDFKWGTPEELLRLSSKIKRIGFKMSFLAFGLL